MSSPRPDEGRGAHVFSGQVWSLLVQAPSPEVGKIPPEDSILPAPTLDTLLRGTESEMRKQLARELNDSVGQVLTLMLVDLEHSDLDQATQDQQVTRIETLEGSARQALQSIRQVLYNVREESPLETGFVQRVRTLLDSVEAGTGIHTKLRVSVVSPSSIPVVVAHNLYGIVEEALNNVRMHSHASNVEVHLAAEVDCVSLLVRDDGRGTHWFDDAVQQGMLGMQERAVLLGGHLDVMSTAGKGTTVRVAAPPW